MELITSDAFGVAKTSFGTWSGLLPNTTYEFSWSAVQPTPQPVPITDEDLTTVEKMADGPGMGFLNTLVAEIRRLRKIIDDRDADLLDVVNRES